MRCLLNGKHPLIRTKPGIPPGFCFSHQPQTPSHLIIPIIQSHSTCSRSLVSRRTTRSLLLLPVIASVMAVSSCEGDSSLPGLEITADTTPIGEGLKVIGFAVLGASVVVVIGKMLR